MKYKVFRGGKIAAQICSVFMWNKFRYPQPVKGRYDVTGQTLEKLKWAYKCWVKQLEVAEKGSGIEEHFRKQDLAFTLPEDFQPEATVSMAAGGDLMAVDCLSYESTPHLFDEIKDFYFDADITCANLESTVYDKAPVGRNQATAKAPRMNTSQEMLERFLDDGRRINYFTTANNHCYDYGEEGLLATLDLLDQKDCWYSGTNRTPADQEDVLIIEKNGIKIAMLSYTFDMNGNEYEKKHLINEVRFNDESVDLTLVQKHIRRAKEKGADLITASIHWGWEFEMYPHRNTIEVGHRLLEMGIDVILGAHPHVSQPMERYTYTKNGVEKQGFIVYSLGDFVSYHPLTKNSKITYVIRYNVTKGTRNGKSETYMHDLQVLPVYILAEEKSEDEYDCRLLRFYNVLADTKGGAPYRYGLDDGERKDAPRLYNKVWKQILMPEKTDHLVVK